MRDLRIVFMGTPDFAVAILDHLLVHKITIVGVVTAVDKPAGRGRKLQESAVKKYAISKNLPILQPTNLKSDAFQSELKSLNANLQIVVAFRMLPRSVWQIPEYGTFNLHASLLPNYRGAAPIHWALINGETTTGVSTFFIDEKIDTGAIIAQKECDIKPDETVGDLHDKLMKLGALLVLETVHMIKKETPKTREQPSIETKSAPKLFSENCKINWNNDVAIVYNKIRGLNPFPAAWTEIQNGHEKITAKIYNVSKITENHSLAMGTILISKKEMKVAVKNGFICIDALKISGKKRMNTIDFLNGFNFEPNSRMLSPINLSSINI